MEIRLSYAGRTRTEQHGNTAKTRTLVFRTRLRSRATSTRCRTNLRNPGRRQKWDGRTPRCTAAALLKRNIRKAGAYLWKRRAAETKFGCTTSEARVVSPN